MGNALVKENSDSSSDCKNSGLDLVLLSALIAITLARDLTDSEQELLASFIQSIGQNLSTIVAARQQCNEKKINTSVSL